MALHENAQVVRVEPGPVLVLADGTRISGSHLLIATGRTPNLEALDLAAGNVRATQAGCFFVARLFSDSTRRLVRWLARLP